MAGETFELKGRAPQWALVLLVGGGLGAGGRELAGSSFKDAVAQVADTKIADAEKRMRSQAEQQLEQTKVQVLHDAEQQLEQAGAQVLRDAAVQGAAQLERHEKWLRERLDRLDERFDRIDQRLNRIETGQGTRRKR